MHVALGVLLATLAQPWVGVGVYPANGVVTASGIDSWTSSGSTAWAGMPAPTVDCIAGASGGAMNCPGATATPSGSPTTTVSPWYPSGFASAPLNAVVYNGSSQYHDVGAVGALAGGSMTACEIYSAGSVSGSGDIMGTYTGSAGWAFYRTTTSAQLYGAGGGGGGSITAAAVILANNWNVVCGSIDQSGGNGSVKYRLNVNGTAIAAVTNANTMADGGNLRIGSDLGGLYFNGSVARVTLWISTAATDAQLATMVNSQLSLLARKPSGGTVTFTSDGGFCWDSTLSRGWWLPSNAPCVTSAGMFVGGQSQNLALQSQTIATGSAFTAPWTESHTVSVSTVSVSGVLAPDGTAAAQVNFPAVSGSDFSVFYQSFAGTATTWSASCMAKAVSGTPSFYLMMTPGGTYRSAICAPTTSAWTRCYVTGAVTAATWYLQIGVDKRDGGQANQSAGSVYLSDCQLEPNPAPTLCHSTLGSPYSGTATAASTPVTLTNPARWCVGTKLVATNSWFVISPAAYLWAIGSGDISVTPAANNAALYSYGSTHIYFDTYDGSNNERSIDYQPSWTAGTSHTLIGCNAGTLQLWADGAQVGSPSGTGTASIDWTTASTAHIQSNGSGAKQFNGSVQKFCQGNTYAAVSSCLSAP